MSADTVPRSIASFRYINKCPLGSYYLWVQDGETVLGCKCLICARCKQHAGNSHQGHYWAYCQVTKAVGAFHFCCGPDNCELETEPVKP